MEFLVLVVMEDKVSQFDPDGLAQRMLGHVHRLEQPLTVLEPAVTELIPVKTFLGFHG
jgi:hypothetical protein